MPSCPVSCIKRHPIHPASHNPSPGTGSPRASIVQAVQKDFLQPSPPTLQHAPFKQHANHTSASKRHANHNPACKPHTNHTPASKPHANHICASKPSSSRPALQFGRLRHVGRYAKDPWCALNLFTNLLLLVLSATTLVLYAADEEVQAERRDRWINIAFCSAGVLVWVRLLQLVVPVYHSLGPLLTTTAAMVSEVVAFVFPYIVVLSGFATLMTGVYADSVTGYSSWIESMLTLFAAMLGDFRCVRGGERWRGRQGAPACVFVAVRAALLVCDDGSLGRCGYSSGFAKHVCRQHWGGCSSQLLGGRSCQNWSQAWVIGLGHKRGSSARVTSVGHQPGCGSSARVTSVGHQPGSSAWVIGLGHKLHQEVYEDLRALVQLFWCSHKAPCSHTPSTLCTLPLTAAGTAGRPHIAALMRGPGAVPRHGSHPATKPAARNHAQPLQAGGGRRTVAVQAGAGARACG
eukprot:365528-Chlamydomonas_euryale.AAC.1